MQINLKQDEIVEAINRYVASQGISTEGKYLSIKFTAGRKNSGISAELKIEDAPQTAGGASGKPSGKVGGPLTSDTPTGAQQAAKSLVDPQAPISNAPADPEPINEAEDVGQPGEGAGVSARQPSSIFN